ncbi:MAG: hypothetical protein LBG97_02570 [Coriobacteriales bacterium]|jgi:sporulation protein YlmC with PRC-barrel domain|nr:hypothetical protein [Coriobacteriales bacterium]
MGTNSVETNKTVLAREAVVIDSRKKLGKVKGLRVDCDTRAISHYIVSSDSTGSDLALPFSKCLALGDTFLTVQSRDDFVPATSEDANKIVRDGFTLIGSEVYSKTGNRLGVVKGYEFDPVFGGVTRVTLEESLSFGYETFIFITPEFMFLDDGAPTAEQLRSSTTPAAASAAAVSSSYVAPSVGSVTESVAAPAAPFAVPAAPPAPVSWAATNDFSSKDSIDDESAEEQESVLDSFNAADTNASDDASASLDDSSEDTLGGFFATSDTGAANESSDEDNGDDEAAASDNAIGATLVGLVVEDDVQSEDGLFSVSKGTTLTEAIVKEAEEHDALLLLAVNVEV